MTKIFLYIILIFGLIGYGIIPLAASGLLFFTDTNVIFVYLILGVCSTVLILQIFSIFLIYNRNIKGLHIFSAILILAALGHISDGFLLLLEGASDSSWLEELDKVILPVFSIWLFYFSDIKDLFVKREEKANV